LRRATGTQSKTSARAQGAQAAAASCMRRQRPTNRETTHGGMHGGLGRRRAWGRQVSTCTSTRVQDQEEGTRSKADSCMRGYVRVCCWKACTMQGRETGHAATFMSACMGIAGGACDVQTRKASRAGSRVTGLTRAGDIARRVRRLAEKAPAWVRRQQVTGLDELLRVCSGGGCEFV
jgi:hypothetical protein